MQTCSFYSYPMRACDAQPNSITHSWLKIPTMPPIPCPKLESYVIWLHRPHCWCFFSCTGGRVGTRLTSLAQRTRFSQGGLARASPPSLNARVSLFLLFSISLFWSRSIMYVVQYNTMYWMLLLHPDIVSNHRILRITATPWQFLLLPGWGLLTGSSRTSSTHFSCRWNHFRFPWGRFLTTGNESFII